MSELLGIHQSITSAYHPQSDGQTERMNRTVEQVLRAHTAHKPREWDTLLSMVEFCMNNSIHAGLQHTPFFLNTGLHPITPIMLETIQANKMTCTTALHHSSARKQAFDFAMQQLRMAKDRYKSYADSHRTDLQFTIGQQVLLSTVNINKHHQKRKLYPKFIGPFSITKRVNDVAYALELPDCMSIHNVFHVSLLKPYIQGKTPDPPPVPITVNGELEYEVDYIIDHRVKTTKRHSRTEYYVKWTGYSAEHCSWEPEEHLQNAPHVVTDYWNQLEAKKLAKMNKRRLATYSDPDTTVSKKPRFAQDK